MVGSICVLVLLIKSSSKSVQYSMLHCRNPSLAVNNSSKTIERDSALVTLFLSRGSVLKFLLAGAPAARGVKHGGSL